MNQKAKFYKLLEWYCINLFQFLEKSGNYAGNAPNNKMS